MISAAPVSVQTSGRSPNTATPMISANTRRERPFHEHILDRKAGHRGHHQNDAAQIVPHASDRQPFFAGMP
jgi:hypothetical protein